jgi:hypothetical protein
VKPKLSCFKGKERQGPAPQSWSCRRRVRGSKAGKDQAQWQFVGPWVPLLPALQTGPPSLARADDDTTSRADDVRSGTLAGRPTISWPTWWPTGTTLSLLKKNLTLSSLFLTLTCGSRMVWKLEPLPRTAPPGPPARPPTTTRLSAARYSLAVSLPGVAAPAVPRQKPRLSLRSLASRPQASTSRLAVFRRPRLLSYSGVRLARRSAGLRGGLRSRLHSEALCASAAGNPLQV